MGLLRSPIGVAGCAILVLMTTAVGLAVLQVDQATRPTRHRSEPLDFELLRMDVAQVDYRAADGVPLKGWLIRGRPDRPAVVLAHDLGSSKASLANLASVLMQDGFTLLLPDFRGHGESGGERSTLGVDEKRDLLAAVTFLASLDDTGPREVGVYGVGMGAHAAVLAAADEPRIQVLVLDGLVPDVATTLGRRLYPGWSFGRDYLSFMNSGVFRLVARADIDDNRAADTLSGLLGRDILFLAPEGDQALVAWTKEMYHSVPEQADADGNLMLLPATQSSGLYGEHLGEYHERVAGFFRARLSVH